jgi:hypothetical protein
MISPLGEVVANQKEWFELYNPNDWDIDLRGFVIRDLDDDVEPIASFTPVIAPAHGYVVLGRNMNPAVNGGAPVEYQYSVMALSKTDELQLFGHGNTKIDEVIWTTGPSPAPVSGKSRELSVNFSSAAQNAAWANWCDAVTLMPDSQNYGTPGLQNSCSK